jgi:hypothetical protein
MYNSLSIYFHWRKGKIIFKCFLKGRTIIIFRKTEKSGGAQETLKGVPTKEKTEFTSVVLKE